MGLLDTLLFWRRNPTRDWTMERDGALPDINSVTLALGPLAFGDGLERARALGLGRPDECRWSKSGTGTLVYKRHGLELEYELGRCVEYTFYTGPEYAQESKGYALATPRLNNGERLSHTSQREQLTRCFGEPETESEDEDDREMLFRRGPNVIECGLDRDGRLSMLTIYVD